MLTDQFETDVREALARYAAEVPPDLELACESTTTAPGAHGVTVVTRIAAVVAIGTGVTGVAIATQSGRAKPGGSSHLAWKFVSDVSAAPWQGTTPSSLQQGNALDCPTTTTCYAEVSIGDSTVTSSIQMEVSHDAGQTWQEATLPSDITQASGLFGGIDCFGAGSCTALAADAAGNYVLIETSDGGQTWDESPGPSPLATQLGISSISCTSMSSCVIVGSFAVGTAQVGQAVAEVTTDGGQTWTEAALPAGYNPFATQCFAGGDCISVGSSLPSQTEIAGAASFSTDGGLTWSTGSLPSATVLEALSCTDTTDCLVISASGQVFSTDDSGQTWSEQSSSDGLSEGPLVNLTCATASVCWASGPSDVVVDKGMPPPVQITGPRQSLAGQLTREEPVKHPDLVTHDETAPPTALTKSVSSPASILGDSTPILAGTTDLGQSWQEAQLPSGPGIVAVGDVSCPSATTCYALAAGTDGTAFLSSTG